MSYKVSIPVFEGPLDLLVYLIENAKMSIYDIRISEITEQYLTYLDNMREMDINIAAEFMVLAATLIDIKSRMLLPRAEMQEDGELPEDPREALVGRILEYKRYKELSAMLGERAERSSLCFEKPQEDISEYTENPDEVLSLSLDKFVSAFKLFLQRERRVAEVKRHYQRVERERATMESCMAYIGARLRAALQQGLKRLRFRELIPGGRDRYDVIVAFTSVLQMVKEHLAYVVQKDTYGEIYVSQAKGRQLRDGIDNSYTTADIDNTASGVKEYVRTDRGDGHEQ